MLQGQCKDDIDSSTMLQGQCEDEIYAGQVIPVQLREPSLDELAEQAVPMGDGCVAKQRLRWLARLWFF